MVADNLREIVGDLIGVVILPGRTIRKTKSHTGIVEADGRDTLDGWIDR